MKRYCLFLVAILAICSCSNEEELESVSSFSETTLPVVVLQERDSSLPTDMTKGKKASDRVKSLVSTRSSIGSSEYLGYSYCIGNSILGDHENVRYSIIDLMRLKNDYPTYTSSLALNSTDTRIFTYSNFGRYETNSSVSKTVDSGFKLNLGLFSIGRKKHIKEVFTSHTLDESKSCMGELSIEVKSNRHMLNSADMISKRIASDYLQPSFLENLYFSTIDDIIATYGEFLVKDYYVGGRVSAEYVTTFSSGLLEEDREKGMTKDIEASFKWKQTSGSANLGFGNTTGSSSSTSQGYENMYMTIKTIGGSGQYAVSLSPSKIQNINIDMTSWLTSVTSNPSTRTFIGLADYGLSPISDYILEENFKKRIQDTHLRNLSTSRLAVPSIEICRVYMRTSSGQDLYGIAPVLKTRHGDRIVLWDDANKDISASDAILRNNTSADVFTQKTNQLYATYKNMFKCAITGNPNEKINSLSRIPLAIELKTLNFSRMKKYVNPKTEMMYIFDDSQQIALALYNDPYILRSYGMADWVNSLQTDSSMSMRVLAGFKIIGL